MKNEPTHGIKDQNGDWQRDARGVVVGDHERIILATCEVMNREAERNGDESRFQCHPLPLTASMQTLIEGLKRKFHGVPAGAIETPYESEDEWMKRTRPQCGTIYKAISEAKQNMRTVQAVLLNPVDAEPMKRNGEMPDRIWGLPLIVDPSIPLGVTRIQ